eukprot:TRINITY_DN20850_c0_g1_i1.p1 TRINITY_DN20850_c0_g1~~TRINITY_DN20850_c0_g1_i1.p1  ORF type:complete len:606 (+),score=186.03 TRINITY_DN20850_c0_g1_i1:61-1878(+)
MQPLAYFAVRALLGWLQFVERDDRAFRSNTLLVLATGAAHCWAVVYALFIAIHTRAMRYEGYHEGYVEHLPFWVSWTETLSVASMALWWGAGFTTAAIRIADDDSPLETNVGVFIQIVRSKKLQAALELAHTVSCVGLFVSILLLCVAMALMVLARIKPLGSGLCLFFSSSCPTFHLFRFVIAETGARRIVVGYNPRHRLTELTMAPTAGTAKDFTDAAQEVKAAAMQSVDEKLRQLQAELATGESMSKEQAATMLKSLRDVFAKEVDDKLAKITQELWKKGQQAMIQVNQKHADTTGKLTQEITKMTERQQALAKENEHLKQAIQMLAGRFQMLGSAFAKLGNPLTDSPNSVGTTCCPPSSGAGNSSRLTSPASQAREKAIYTAALGSMPVAPPFPLPGPDAMAAAIPAPPGLSAAKPPLPPPSANSTPAATPQLRPKAHPTGSPTITKTQLSLAESLTPSLPVPAATTPASVPPGSSFSFTLRKADGISLGLNVSHKDEDTSLLVEGFQPEGAIEAWNRLCYTNPAQSAKAVKPGDQITKVNDVEGDPQKMLEECKLKKLLKITILRPEEAAPPAAAAGGSAAAAKSLRAEASEFVPGTTQEE